MSIKKRKESLERSRNNIVKEYEKKINRISQYLDVLDKSYIESTDSVEVVAFKLYMQLDNVAKVANQINDLGFRITTNSYIGKRKYNSNDITAIITNKEAKVELNLKNSVQEIQEMNYGKVAKRWF